MPLKLPTTLCLLLTAYCLLPTTHCAAETKDRLVIRQPNGSGMGVNGTIVEFLGREIHIRLTANSQPRSYNLDEVVEISYGRLGSHLDGMEALEAHQPAQALRLLGRALELEERRWVRREILAQQSQCEKQLGHYGAAAAKFLTIIESDPETHYYKQIPLIWVPRELTDQDKTRARVWLEGSLATARLIGASFLLGDADHAPTVNHVLRKLVTHPDPRVVGLAHAQSWRHKITARLVTAQDLTDWKRRLDRTPEELRAGPYYLLGRAHATRREHLKAAGAFLWLPIVYEDDRQFSARACLEAAHALAAAGQKKQAATLYREITSRFPNTKFAPAAQDALPKKDQN